MFEKRHGTGSQATVSGRFWLHAFALALLITGIAITERAAAYDVCSDSGRCTHEEMVGYAYKVYIANGGDPTLIDSLLQIGAGHEDEVDHIYGWHTVSNAVTVTHFWDADRGRDARSSLGALDDLINDGAPFPNGWQKVEQYWSLALGEYANGNTTGAYHFLGHIAHHIGDNTIPTHAHSSAHDPLSGDDSFEDWMSQGGSDDPDGFGGSDLSSDEQRELNGPIGTYAPKAGGNDPLRFVDLNFDIPEFPGVETPLDKLYWLLYTTNQIADFFPSDRATGDTFDPEGWVETELRTMDASITSPQVPAHLDNNDDDDDDDDGDLSVIRDYSYLRGIRAIAGLFRLFEQTVNAQPRELGGSSGAIVAVVIESVEALDNCDDNIFDEDCDFYSLVTIDGTRRRNEGDESTNDDDIFPNWAWGQVVGTNGSIPIKISILDEDNLVFDPGVNITREAGNGLTLSLDLAKCLAGEDGAITGASFTGGGRCGQTLTTNPTGDEDDDSQGIARVTFSVKMIQVRGPRIIEEDSAITSSETIQRSDKWIVRNGAVLTIDPGVVLTVSADSTLSNSGTIVNQGTIRIENGVDSAGQLVVGRIDNELGGRINNFNRMYNYGHIENRGAIYDPMNRYEGKELTPNPVSRLHWYLGPDSGGQQACGWLEGEWDESSDSCTIGDYWIAPGYAVEVGQRATLIVDGLLSNDGTLINCGTINNEFGAINNCGFYDGNAPTNASRLRDCDPSEDRDLCDRLAGFWKNPTNECRLRFSRLDPDLGQTLEVTVNAGETLTINPGATFYLEVFLTNFGTVVINGTLINQSKIINHGVIINNGQFHSTEDGSSGIGASIENFEDGTIENFGTFENSDSSLITNNGSIVNFGTFNSSSRSGIGGIVGEGSIYNRCGSTYSSVQEANAPPDFPNIGYEDCKPTITVYEPSLNVSGGALVLVSWEDDDTDSNATIALYYRDAGDSTANGVLIVDGIPEDPDDAMDRYEWDLSGLAPGSYSVYAVIRDAASTVESPAAPGIVTILPPMGIDETFLRGDCNNDGAVNISDAVFSLGSLFLGDGNPVCDDACDSNDDGTVDIADTINTLSVIFLGQGQIPSPGMALCGLDPTEDGLGCQQPSENCP